MLNKSPKAKSIISSFFSSFINTLNLIKGLIIQNITHM